jgi:hypothetical protein
MPMTGTTSEEYRAEASRFRDFANKATDPRQGMLYRQIEDCYLTLAADQEIKSSAKPADITVYNAMALGADRTRTKAVNDIE